MTVNVFAAVLGLSLSQLPPLPGHYRGIKKPLGLIAT